MQNDRLRILKEQLHSAELAGIALIPGPSLFYLSGIKFHLMERPIVAFFPSEGEPLLVCPQFELTKAEASTVPWRTTTYGENPAQQEDAFAHALSQIDLSAGKLGVEPLNLRFHELSLMQRAAGELELTAADDIVGGMRLRKDADEIDNMRQAVRIAEQAMEATLPKIAAGMTEREVASLLTMGLFQSGSDTDLPFEPIVASGPNSANPHATPTNRKLRHGELLLIDWGARHDGYCSDLTRTFAIGEASDRMIALHQAVLAANEAGRAAVMPEATAGSVDAAGRAAIEALGMGKLFSHRIGHGLGLEAHEPPYLYGENEAPLQTGMAFTVEPGAYETDWGGVRIEDNVVVTATGVESLSQIDRQLRSVG